MAFPPNPAANEVFSLGGIRRVYNNGVWSRASGVVKHQITGNVIRPKFGDYQIFLPSADATLTIGDFTDDGVNLDEFYLEIVNGGNYNITYPASFVFTDGTIPELSADGKDLLGVTRDPRTGKWIAVVITKNVLAAA